MDDRKFLWGNSVSCMQTEGAYNIDGKGKSVYDIIEETKDKSDWKVAIDEYHRYKEDIEIMKKMGVNCYRFQISWSRVYPNGFGEINDKAVSYYNDLIDCLIENDITPMICLYHFDMPLSLSKDYDGFSSKFVTEKFIEYGKKMVDLFSEKVKYWITFNEHNLYATNLAFQISGSNVKKDYTNLYQIEHNVIYAHSAISNYINRNYSDVKIGGMLAYTKFYPNSSSPYDNYLTMQYDKFLNKLFLDLYIGRGYPTYFKRYLKDRNVELDITDYEINEINNTKSDFIAFSYYRSAVVDSKNKFMEYDALKGDDFIDNKYLQRNEWNWEIDPLGLRILSNDIYYYTKTPLFIIENGIGLREELDKNGHIEDDLRIKYHKDHIQNMKDAIEKDGVEYIGYLGWGLIDILSSSGDMEKRYGAVYVNRGNHDLRDLKRIPKKSFEWFKKAFESDGKDL